MVSKFFGVVALVILVQYVIADESQQGSSSPQNTESSSAAQACLPSADLVHVEYQTFKKASEVNNGLPTPDLTFQGLQQDLDAWGSEETNAQAKTDFLSKLDTTYQGKPTEYQTLRTLLIEEDKTLHDGTTAISEKCYTSSTTNP